MFRRFLAVLFVCGFSAGSVFAAPTVSMSIDPTNTIPGVTARKIVVDGQGVDWTAAVLVIELTQGSVYNGSPDSNGPQDAFWGFFPELEWDTYVGIPGGINDVGPLSASDLGSPVVSFSGSLVSATWGNTDVTNTGPTQIANISLTDDAQGTWQMIATFANSPNMMMNGNIMAPEPGTLALLGLGGVALMRRR